MVCLSREIIIRIVADLGPAEVLRRLSDPFWFQAFGCVLGFDWHSSGVTTTVCGAVKEGLREIDAETGLFAGGGKGGVSRQTPIEIAQACERLGRDPSALVYASRMAAKVDSAAVQDGYQLYHHAFFFTASGDWCVVQQGMSDDTKMARRYHWLAETVRSFVEEPHEAVCCDARGAALNLVAAESGAVRVASARLAAERPEVTLDALSARAAAARAAGGADPASRLPPAESGIRPARSPLDETTDLPALAMPARHPLLPGLDVATRRLRSILLTTYEQPPADFEALLGRPGVGPRTLRALALASELIYGTPASTRDPARFAFAHGGKDGTPYPVDRGTYEQTIDVLGRAINRAAVDRSEKVRAFRRLAVFGAGVQPTPPT